MALFALLLLLGNSMTWFGLAYFCLGGFRLARSMMPALARPIVRESELGLAFGTLEAVADSALIFAPILAGAIFTVDPHLVFLIAAPAILVMVGIYLIYLVKGYRGAILQRQAG